MEVVRMKLEIPQYAGSRTRWNSTNNTFEIQLPDGTWVEDTTTDYRHAESGRLPMRGGTDKECLAAANATQMLRDTIDATLATFNEIGIASAAIGVGMAFIPELVSKGFAIGFAFASLALSVGSEILIESFDQDAYDAIKCALFCSTDGNGQWSADGLSTALDIIHSDPFIDDACDTITSFIFGTLWGEVGLSNAGTRTKVTSASCTSCDCPYCYRFDFSVSSWSFAVTNGSNGFDNLPYGSYGSGRWNGVYNSPNLGGVGAYIYRTFSEPATLESIEIRCYLTSTGDRQCGWRTSLNGTQNGNKNSGTLPSGNNTVTWSGAGDNLPRTFDAIEIWIYAQGVSGVSQCSEFTIRGTGLNPMGDDNCV